MTSADGLSPAASSASRLSDVEYASDPDILEGKQIELTGQSR